VQVLWLLRSLARLIDFTVARHECRKWTASCSVLLGVPQLARRAYATDGERHYLRGGVTGTPRRTSSKQLTRRLFMDRTGFVTSSLCRGLADNALAALEAQGARFTSGLPAAVRRRMRTKKDLRQGVSELTRLGEAAHLVQVIGRTPNERDALISQFAPYTVSMNRGSSRMQLRFYLLQTIFSVRRGMGRGSDSGDVLEVDEHAVERLFLRLQTLSLESVADELRDAMLFALPLTEVAERLGLRQIALPTSNGAFLCHYTLGSRLMLAKTWLPAEGMGFRWGRVHSLIRQANETFGGEDELARLLGAGMKRSIAEGESGVIDVLMSALSRVHWLKEQYLSRPDVVGENWEAAKRQAVTT
jgi:hypothetical protein